jgi:hypothetical protein
MSKVLNVSQLVWKTCKLPSLYSLVDSLKGGSPIKRGYKEEWLKIGTSISTLSAWYVWLVSRYHSFWSVLIPMEVYVMADTHGLRAMFMRIR